MTITDTHTFWEEEGILCFSYNKSVVDIDIAKKGLAIRQKLTKGKPCLVFTDLSNVINITNDARDFYASPEGLHSTVALGVLAPTNLTRVLCTFFLTFNRPTIPFKFFDTKEKAFEWLSGFKKDLEQ